MIKVKSLHTNHKDYYCENLQEGSWSMDVVLVWSKFTVEESKDLSYLWSRL